MKLLCKFGRHDWTIQGTFTQENPDGTPSLPFQIRQCMKCRKVEAQDGSEWHKKTDFTGLKKFSD
ncbi:hypothetical protein ACFL6N_03625 [Thermodesulfobacteriota bacterium]